MLHPFQKFRKYGILRKNFLSFFLLLLSFFHSVNRYCLHVAIRAILNICRNNNNKSTSLRNSVGGCYTRRSVGNSPSKIRCYSSAFASLSKRRFKESCRYASIGLIPSISRGSDRKISFFFAEKSPMSLPGSLNGLHESQYEDLGGLVYGL